MTLDLILIGFGNVGRRFASLLGEQRDRLERQHDLGFRVIGIATRRHGIAYDPKAGLDLERARTIVGEGGTLDALSSRRRAGDGGTRLTSALDLIEQASHRPGARPAVLVETTILDIAHGQPATDHVRKALRSGCHVITANKGPVAFAYRELHDLANAAERSFLFEGAVMDGVPVFNFARETLPGVQVIGFRGVINSTTNHILTTMEHGGEFAEALAEMQAAGIAEADASLDVDGWDAAAKTAALVNVLMNGTITPYDVRRTGIGGMQGGEVRAAVARGERIRLVASARRNGDRIDAEVSPAPLPAGDLLAGLSGAQNAVVLKTDLLGEVAVVQLDSGLTQTAYALVSDLVTLRRRL
jgi:homoserine dehydrogenase